MLRRVRKYIADEHLLRQGDRVLVALSGGADSVALLDVLRRAGYDCLAAHCNFHLRGEESLRDEHFVRDLCRQMAVPLLVHDFDTAAYAREHKLSIEMAARDLRYAWFAEAAQAHQCAAIAVAHHQNDQAETLILNLLRGSGIRGLCGMRPIATNPIAPASAPVIRPLLCTTRDYIEYYLRDKRRLTWVNDSTNTDTAIPRNAIRAILAQCNKAEIENIATTARRMQGYVDLLEHRDTREAGIVRLYEELREYRFPEIDKLYDALQRGVGGKVFHAPEHTATIHKGKLMIEQKHHTGTRHFGIIGYPLEHSFSAKYFTEKFRREGIDADYRLFPMAENDLPKGPDDRLSPMLRLIETLDGMNVTYPYKQTVIPYLDGLDDTARAIGAVNVIYRRIGYNTDCLGFVRSLRPLLSPTDRHALVLGTGGAAKAVVYGLHTLGIETTTVSRTPREGQLGYDQIDAECLRRHTLIVNCTPLGMHPNVDACPPIPYPLLGPQHLLYDCVYNPEETLFLRRGREQGARTKNGLDMLYGQAEEAWKIWNTNA